MVKTGQSLKEGVWIWECGQGSMFNHKNNRKGRFYGSRRGPNNERMNGGEKKERRDKKREKTKKTNWNPPGLPND